MTTTRLMSSPAGSQWRTRVFKIPFVTDVTYARIFSDTALAADVYFRHVNFRVPKPKLALCGFARVPLRRGESAGLSAKVSATRLRCRDVQKNQYVTEPGDYKFLVGEASDDIRLKLPVTFAGANNH